MNAGDSRTVYGASPEEELDSCSQAGRKRTDERGHANGSNWSIYIIPEFRPIAISMGLFECLVVPLRYLVPSCSAQAGKLSENVKL